MQLSLPDVVKQSSLWVKEQTFCSETGSIFLNRYSATCDYGSECDLLLLRNQFCSVYDGAEIKVMC